MSDERWVAQCSICGRFMSWPFVPMYPWDVHASCQRLEDRREWEADYYSHALAGMGSKR